MPATTRCLSGRDTAGTQQIELYYAFPLDQVGEVHLGGHDEDRDDHGRRLLIDSHGAEVVDPVWALYARVIASAG